jgi:muramoyltetrapeptide carboxypeptidase LdcA involved in peptidoglycan recycling
MMQAIYPPKLTPGDELRVISPSKSMHIVSKEVRSIAKERLEAMGLKVSFSRHFEQCDLLSTSSVASRIEDLHEAFQDSNVKGILTTLGGFSANQLLPYIDYALIKKNPKFFCGFSDITTLQNALFAKTGLVTFSGPHFSTFGCLKELDYVIAYFKKAAFSTEEILLHPSSSWSDDLWFLNQDKREFHHNEGFLLLQPGEAQGRLIGGNLSCFNLLQGTEYRPSLEGSVLFLEATDSTSPEVFDRDLQALMLQRNFSDVQAILIGRFQKGSKMTPPLLKHIISSKKALSHLPIVANLDFGHTLPFFTYPIGGWVNVHASSHKVEIRLFQSR